LVATALSALASPGWAGAIDDTDDSQAVRGTTVAARPELAGVVLRDKLIDFEIRDGAGRVAFAGRLQDRVVQSRQRNTMIFHFRIRDTRTGLPCRITEVRRETFSGWNTDMDFALDGQGTVGPDTVKRTSGGATVGFRFDKTPIEPGAESRFCFVFTGATKYTPNGGSLTIIANDGSKVTLPIAAPEK
jgi:hypothetical protein